MYQDNINGISIKLILDTRSKNKKGLYPVRVQVIHLRTPKYFSTGKNISEEEWSKLPTTRLPTLVEVRNCSKDYFDLIQTNIKELAAKGEFSFDTLNVYLGRNSGGSLQSYLKARIKELDEENRIGTRWIHESALSNIERFTKKEIPIASVTPEWLKKFESHMVDRGVSYSTIGIRMRTIRTIMNLAKKQGVIKESQYPFGQGKYAIRTSEGNKKALTLEQIGKIARFSCDNEEIMFFRDMWLFIYLCNGINVADLVKLKFKDIDNGEICFVRRKTEGTSGKITEIRATLLPEMQEIIDRWGNEPLPNNFIFNTLGEEKNKEYHMKKRAHFIKKMNTNMSFIGSVLGIGDITTYTARHSYATVLKRSGANIAYISESLGHNNIKTTYHYLASFEADARKENAALLTQYKSDEL